MRMIIIAISISIALSYTNQTYAQRDAIMIRGAQTCGEWLKAREKDPQVAQIFEWWILGFIGGNNLAENYDFWTETGYGSDQVYYYIDKYCRDNPLSHIVPGLLPLISKKTK